MAQRGGQAFTPTFRSILCPVDFSDHSRVALRYAAGLAERFGARLTVLFVNDPLLLTVASGSGRAARREFLERTKDELRAFIDAAVRVQRSGGERIDAAVAVGNPADEILRAAKRGRHDLVVVGTHGLSGLQRLFFGSTTEQVLHRARTAVLAIPPAKGRRVADPAAVAHVVVPIDLAGEWESDAVRGATIAAAFDADLLLLHVLAPVQTPPWFGGGKRRRKTRVDTATKALQRVAAQLPAAAQTRWSVVVGDAAHEIAAVANDPSTLVAMSLRGTAGIWGRRGSIAYHVLTHTPTPVLALPRRATGGPLSRRLARAVTNMLSERDRIEIAGIDALLSFGSRGKRVRR